MNYQHVFGIEPNQMEVIAVWGEIYMCTVVMPGGGV